MTEQHRNSAPDGADDARRSRLRRLVVKGSFAAPLIASFAMSALTVDKAAAAPNTTASKTIG